MPMAFNSMIRLRVPAVDQRSTWTTGAAPSGLLTSSWETVCISYDDFLVFFFYGKFFLSALRCCLKLSNLIDRNFRRWASPSEAEICYDLSCKEQKQRMVLKRRQTGGAGGGDIWTLWSMPDRLASFSDYAAGAVLRFVFCVSTFRMTLFEGFQ